LIDLKRNQDIEVLIEDHEFPATGIAFLENRKIRIKGAFPGQTIHAKASKIHKDRADGRFIAVLKPAEYEVEAPCPHFVKCGGCISQNIPMELQEKFKEEEVMKLFRQHDLDMGEYLGFTGVKEQFEYRNKMEFTFGDEIKGGELTLGMHHKGMRNSIITVSSCMLVTEDYRKILDYTVGFFQDLGLPYYRVMRQEGYLRNLVIRRGENTRELMVNLVTTTQMTCDLESFKNGLLELELDYALVSILHTENDNLADAVTCEKLNVLHGRDHIFEKLNGLTFKISPFSFFQTNTRGAELLYGIVKGFIGERKKEIFDLYCGTGTIGQVVSDMADKVTGVELIEEAVASAKENALLNNLDHTHFIAGDVKDVIAKLEGSPDLIILDPPRSGVHPKALEYVVDFNAHEIIYVSCNPKTLVNDLSYLVEKGYVINKTKIVDLFPNTPHVETVVCMQKVTPQNLV
jgi:23S rRNA (uracil-5-)-methyltransferase RumA